MTPQMVDRVLQREEKELLLYALYIIATESTDAENVRVALVALYESAEGRAFLAANPIKV